MGDAAVQECRRCFVAGCKGECWERELTPTEEARRANRYADEWLCEAKEYAAELWDLVEATAGLIGETGRIHRELEQRETHVKLLEAVVKDLTAECLHYRNEATRLKSEGGGT